MTVGTRSGIEQVLELSGQVLQPVLSERDKFNHFRGLHLGAVCLNYLQGMPILNPHASSSVHFTSSYEYAVGIARSQAQSTLRHVLQFEEGDARQLSELVGEDVT